MPAAPHPTQPQPVRLTRAQVREVDRIAIERYHIPGIVLMENASRAVADEACDMLGSKLWSAPHARGRVAPATRSSGDTPPRDRPCEILILCGGGNNGGDGLAVARHLHNRGARVTLALATDPAGYKGDALINWRTVQAMDLPVERADRAVIARPGPRLIIDAIFGTGLDRPPRDPFPQIAGLVEQTGLPVLAVDLPSGLDCDTGRPLGACIRATRTVTFVAEKVGFAEPQARHWLGDVVIGDIGCPAELIEEAAKLLPAAGRP